MGFWNSINTAFQSVTNAGTQVLGTVLNSSAANTAVGSLLGGGGGSTSTGGISAGSAGGSTGGLDIGGLLTGLLGGGGVGSPSNNVTTGQPNQSSFEITKYLPIVIGLVIVGIILKVTKIWR